MGIFELAKKGFYGGTYRGIITDSLLNRRRGVLFNSVTQHGDDYSSSITQHAIEDGAPITDNIYNNPVTLSLTVVLKEPSFNLVTGLGLIGQKTVKERFNQLLKWRSEKKLLTFAYNDAFENMAIAGLSREASKDLGKGIRLSLRLQKITIATATIEANKKGLTDKKEATPAGLN